MVSVLERRLMLAVLILSTQPVSGQTAHQVHRRRLRHQCLHPSHRTHPHRHRRRRHRHRRHRRRRGRRR